MEQKFVSNGIAFDTLDGAGAVSDAHNVDYMGFLAMIRPSTFLALCAPLPEGRTHVDDIMDAGQPIGLPFLVVDLQDETRSVRQHEGRHRMRAILRIAGDEPVPVAMLLSHGDKARHVEVEHVVAFSRGMVPEHRGAGDRRARIEGPIFETAILRGEEVDLQPAPAPAP